MSGLPASIRFALGAAVVALVVTAAAGCAGGDIGASTPGSSGQSFVGSSYQSTYYSPGHRQNAPLVSGTTTAGQHLSLSAYRGSVVVINPKIEACSEEIELREGCLSVPGMVGDIVRFKHAAVLRS